MALAVEGSSDAGKSGLEPGQPVWGSSASPDGVIHQLYRAEAAALERHVFCLVRSRAEAQDIAQDAFVRVWRALMLGTVRAPRAVLFKAGRNLALNHLRNRRVRDSAAALSSLDILFGVPAATAEDAQIAADEAERCRHAMNGLPDRCREVMRRRIVDELAYSEIASEMHLSVSALEKYVSRGKRVCRERLSKEAAESRQRDPALVAPVRAAATRSSRKTETADAHV
jgi:RNA polymerase sigma-70 factor (ECF subfamily)